MLIVGLSIVWIVFIDDLIYKSEAANVAEHLYFQKIQGNKNNSFNSILPFFHLKGNLTENSITFKIFIFSDLVTE
jgi:hypothetical protein